MKLTYLLCTVLSAFIIFVPMHVKATEPTTLTQITKHYLAAKSAVQQKHSTDKDIEHMLTFFSDAIQVQHMPHTEIHCKNDFKAKERFRQGLGHYLGKYDDTQIKILDITEGVNMVAVKFTETIKHPLDGKQLTTITKALYVLEFDGHLITREYRYDL